MNAARSRLAALGSSPTGILVIVCLGVFSTALDQTVVVAALPSVMIDLEIPLTDLDRASWIVTAYLVSYTVAMPLAGRLSDVYGRVKMFQAALVLFAIGSALVALAPNFEWIVAARVIQAFGGGATVPIGLAMAVGVVSPERRGVALGIVAASAEAGSVLGPLYGGGIIELLGWRWIFWLDVPQSFILIALLAILRNYANPNAKMDYVGALLLGAALTVLTMGLAQRSIFSGESLLPYGMLVFGVFLVAILIVMERRTVQPLFASFLYTSRAFVASNATQFLVGVALIISLVAVPLMAATVMEKPAWESAMHLIRLTAAIPVGAVAGGFMLRWTGVRPVCIAGLAFIGVGLLFMSGWETEVEQVRLTAPAGDVRPGLRPRDSRHQRQRLERRAQHLLGRRRLASDRVADGRHGARPRGAVRVGHRALLQPHRRCRHRLQLRGDRGAVDRGRGDRLPEPLYDCRPALPGRHPPRPAYAHRGRLRHPRPPLTARPPVRPEGN